MGDEKKDPFHGLPPLITDEEVEAREAEEAACLAERRQEAGVRPSVISHTPRASGGAPAITLTAWRDAVQHVEVVLHAATSNAQAPAAPQLPPNPPTIPELGAALAALQTQYPSVPGEKRQQAQSIVDSLRQLFETFTPWDACEEEPVRAAFRWLIAYCLGQDHTEEDSTAMANQAKAIADTPIIRAKIIELKTAIEAVKGFADSMGVQTEPYEPICLILNCIDNFQESLIVQQGDLRASMRYALEPLITRVGKEVKTFREALEDAFAPEPPASQPQAVNNADHGAGPSRQRPLPFQATLQTGDASDPIVALLEDQIVKLRCGDKDEIANDLMALKLYFVEWGCFNDDTTTSALFTIIEHCLSNALPTSNETTDHLTLFTDFEGQMEAVKNLQETLDCTPPSIVFSNSFRQSIAQIKLAQAAFENIYDTLWRNNELPLSIQNALHTLLMILSEKVSLCEQQYGKELLDNQKREKPIAVKFMDATENTITTAAIDTALTAVENQIVPSTDTLKTLLRTASSEQERANDFPKVMRLQCLLVLVECYEKWGGLAPDQARHHFHELFVALTTDYISASSEIGVVTTQPDLQAMLTALKNQTVIASATRTAFTQLALPTDVLDRMNACVTQFDTLFGVLADSQMLTHPACSPLASLMENFTKHFETALEAARHQLRNQKAIQRTTASPASAAPEGDIYD